MYLLLILRITWRLVVSKDMAAMKKMNATVRSVVNVCCGVEGEFG